MVSSVLTAQFERDLRKLIGEVNLFEAEENLWKTAGTVKNCCGNLVLHIVGNLNFYLGTVLDRNGYVRDRPGEFAEKGVPRQELVAQLERLIPLIESTLGDLPTAQLDGEYPIIFDEGKNSITYVLIRLVTHLNYHLGQVNYLRRILEAPHAS